MVSEEGVRDLSSVRRRELYTHASELLQPTNRDRLNNLLLKRMQPADYCHAEQYAQGYPTDKTVVFLALEIPFSCSSSFNALIIIAFCSEKGY